MASSCDAGCVGIRVSLRSGCTREGFPGPVSAPVCWPPFTLSGVGLSPLWVLEAVAPYGFPETPRRQRRQIQATTAVDSLWQGERDMASLGSLRKSPPFWTGGWAEW